MIRYAAGVLLCAGLFLSGCSRQEQASSDAEEWADIQPFPDEPVEVPPDLQGGSETGSGSMSDDADFSVFRARLEQMKTVERKVGETLLTGEKLTLDYDQHFVRMEENVVLTDDHGRLETSRLTGRFSESNQIDRVEAEGDVQLVSDGRTARSDQAVYDYGSRMVQLDGQAEVSDGGNRLSGERIRFWIEEENRRMICEPNAFLVVSREGENTPDGLPARSGDTEIRAGRIIYDAGRRFATLEGGVRLRDPQVAMNCEKVRLYLKDNNEIDWIDARSGVIIQTEDRKAVADRATYHADEGKFTLEGNPKVMQGAIVMTGDRIMFWLENRRMVCEPNARVLLYLDEETKAKFLKDLND